MKIQENLKNSLKIGSNSSVIPDANYKKLLDNCFAALTGNDEPHNLASLYNSKPDLVKEFHGILLSITARFVRHNLNVKEIEQVFSELSYTQQRITLFCESYQKYRQDIEMALLNVGSNLPHITDVSWKIDYIVKASNLDSNDGPLFRVAFETQQSDNRVEYIRFNCTAQELQDLVYTLKDAVRHCQRIGNGSS